MTITTLFYFNQEAYKYTFSRTIDWQGSINYYRNLPLADFQMSSSPEDVEPIPVQTLFIIGNMDPEVSLDLVSQSAKYVDR